MPILFANRMHIKRGKVAFLLCGKLNDGDLGTRTVSISLG